MRRFLVSFPAIVFLVLSLILAGCWVRSHWVADLTSLTVKHEGAFGFTVYNIDSIGGSMHFGWLSTPSSLPGDERYGFKVEHLNAADIRVFGDHWGFGVVDNRHPLNSSMAPNWEIWLPNWFIMLALTPLAIPWLTMRFRSARRHKRIVRRLCPTCGYDLRATPDRCPECGAAVIPRNENNA